MFHLKKPVSATRKYSKTLPDQRSKHNEVLLLEQDAKEKLYELSSLTNDVTVTNHLSSWVHFGKEPHKAHEKQNTVRSDMEMVKSINRLNSKGGVHIKRQTFAFLKKKKYERECQFKKSLKNAVRESKTKNSCIGINFQIPSQNSFYHDRIHSYSMRIRPQTDRTTKKTDDFSQTEPLLGSSLFHLDQRKDKSESKVCKLYTKHKKLQSSLLVHKKRSSCWSPLNLKFDELKIERGKSLNNMLGVLNNLLDFQKQKVCLPVKPAISRNKMKGTFRRKDRLLTK